MRAGPRSIPIVLLLAGACAGEAPPPDAVATWNGGHVSVREARSALSVRHRGFARLSADAAAERLRATAEEIVIRRSLLDGVDLPAEVERLGAELDAPRRRIAVSLFLRDRLDDGRITVTAEQIDARYRAHRESFEIRPRRNVWHLFRRHREGEPAGAAAGLLEELRLRIEAGESFAELARRYSDSETGALGGHLGWIDRGRLAEPLDELVFALEPGVVSRPVEVSGGATIFRVTEAIEPMSPALDDVRDEIAQVLAEEERTRRVAELLAEAEPPETGRVLEDHQLSAALANTPDDVAVLEIGDGRMTAKELRELVEADRQALPVTWRSDPEGALARLYRRQDQDLRVYAEAVRSGFVEQPEVGRAVEERIEPIARQKLVEERVEERTERYLDRLRDDGELKRFYADNRFLYQSPLALKISTLGVPVGDDPGRAASLSARLAVARGGVETGEIDLDALAAELGGEVTAHGWVDFDELASLEPKVRHYLLELGGLGYTAPFQLGGRLHVIRVEERREPTVLPYEQVVDRVRDHYRERRGQDILDAVSDEILAAADFRFYPEVVESDLRAGTVAPPGSTGTAE